MMTLAQRLHGKRVGVVLSAGFFGFFGHAGFVDGLLQNGVTPAAWAGTSAGGMIAGLCAAGLAPAREAGIKVKLNTVALQGINEGEIPQIVEWAHARGHEVTLIEVMPLGEIDEDRTDHYLPLTVVREALEKRWTLTPSDARTGGPARYVEVAETGGRLGFITPLTNNFCDGCNRIRVTATGQLYACLGGAERVDLRAALRSDEPQARLAEALDLAMRIKPERHHFRIERGAAPAQPRHMSMTGG